jgi:hypothetical protein
MNWEAAEKTSAMIIAEKTSVCIIIMWNEFKGAASGSD